MKNNEKGFTLAELAVVFAILLMLSSISVAGVLAYQDYADFKRQNSYAQTLFTAAQSQLTAYSVRGGLEGLQAVSKEQVLPDTILTPSGEAASESSLGENAKKSKIYYLTGTAEAYQQYKNGEYRGKTDSDSMGYQLLYDIFDEYLYDKTILEAAVALEYNPQEGLVYAVLYSDKNEAFTYLGENRDGRVNICNRQEDYRSEYLIGYYGVE